MRKFLSLVAMLLVTAASFAQKGPQIKFKAIDNTIDYGTVKKSTDNGVRVFEFVNIGDQPLVITNAKSSCGCTVPSKPEAPVMPGQTGKIEVKYNMNPGKISKVITVESNATNVDNGVVALKIKGEVISE